jgi:type I restriction-modification system DNA methylase subunit
VERGSLSNHSIKGLREEFRAVGKFHTPPELALFLRSLIPGDPERVYDPTCGAGSLLAAFPDEVPKYGQDIDAAAVEDARLALENFHGHVGDVLTDPAWMDERFDAIVANPPFSVRWEPTVDERFMSAPTVPTGSRADFAFLLHILHMLAPRGIAAVLSFPGILYRGGREKMLREWLVEQNYIDQVISIPGSTFTDTAISTACVVLKRGRTTDSIRFIDRENAIERDVELAEIRQADYTLSVSSFVQPPPIEREPFDAWAVEQQARADLIRQLRNGLNFSRQVSEFEGFPLDGLIDDAQTVLDEFRAA